MSESKSNFKTKRTITNEKPQEPSKEQLMEHIDQLTKEYQRMYEMNKQLSNNNAIIRLELLFKVLEKQTFFPKTFIKNCAEEIVAMLTLPELEETPVDK